jgi:AraC-like DNA-binding protein
MKQTQESVELLLDQLTQALSHDVDELTKAKAKQLLTHLEQSQPTLPEDTLITNVLNYISEHYLEPLSLGAIATRFHRAPAHLTTRFRKATGMPIMECVLEKRMNEAKQLLSSTHKPVQSIAEHVGYSDVTLFSRHRAPTVTAPTKERPTRAKPRPFRPYPQVSTLQP